MMEDDGHSAPHAMKSAEIDIRRRPRLERVVAVNDSIDILVIKRHKTSNAKKSLQLTTKEILRQTSLERCMSRQPMLPACRRENKRQPLMQGLQMWQDGQEMHNIFTPMQMQSRSCSSSIRIGHGDRRKDSPWQRWCRDLPRY